MKPLYCLLFLIFLSLVTYAQERVDITTCEGTGTGIVCVAPGDSLYKLCVKVATGPCTDKNYTIDWGDGKIENIVLNSTLTLNHEYDLRNFVRNCSNGEFKVSIFVENKTCPNDNKGFRVTFNKKPEAKPTVPAACEGSSFNITNNSCPTSSDIKFLWEFSDGQTSTSTYPNVSFTDPNKTYHVKLTATSATCGSSTSELDFKMTKLPVADFKTTGLSVIDGDSVVCLSGGAVLTVDGTPSIDETGYQWQISGNFSYQDNTNSRSGIIKIKLNQAGTYTIRLVTTNSCGNSRPLVKTVKVISLPVLSLTPQPDVCEEIKYKISNPPTGATYTLNGQPLDPTQEATLPLSATPYIITASLSNACGTQMVADTFTVSAAQPVKIISFPRDTTLCVSTVAMPLNANIPGGVWSTQGVETQNGKSVFVPKTAGEYTISYTKGTGKCLTTDAVHVKVDGLQVTVTDQAICAGTQFIKLQGSPAGGKWTTSACSGCIRNDTLITASLSASPIVVTYEAGNQTGCKATADAKITIGQPKAGFEIAGGCTGSAFRPVNNSSGASAYTWLVNGNNVSSEARPSLNLPAGIQKITLIARSGNCSDTISKQVTITPPPSPVSFTPSETLGCAPLRTTFLINGTPDINAEYTWTFGNGSTFTGAAPPAQIFENNEKINRTYTVTLASKNGCGLETFSKEVVVRPFVQAEIGVDSTTIRCTPARMLFSNRSTGHDKAASRWIFGDGIIQQTGQDTLYHTFMAKDTAVTYQVQLEISSVCGLDTAKVEIKVFPNDVKALFTISKSIVCPGETIQFKDATVPKPTQWLWKFGDGSVSTLANPTHSFAQPEKEFKVTLTAYTTCGYDSTQLTVKTTTAPTGSFTDVPVACQGSEVQFVNKSDTSLGFVWDFGDGTPQDSTNYSPSHTYAVSGNYAASLYVFRGSQTCKVLAKKTAISVVSAPVAKFGFQGDSLFCAPGPVSILNLSENADSYQWSFSDGRTSDVKNPSLPFEEGLYSVKLIAGKGGVCRDSLERMAAFAVQHCQVDIPQAFTPNGDGVGDRYTLFGNGILKINSLRIRNRWGEMVFEAKNIPAGSQQPGESWDGNFGGKPAPADMYVYEAEVLYIDNRISDKLRGNIYLVR
ncbi:hypothetical protein DYBT9275_04060 [Dyadobacter sp. CECT 9275]|uniref:PKD domain-containing protein n=1 Tax=Dyadobacter helix TaxID=2822344 RepID=A0A916JIN0_9BACT|nr:PKD domain-containing protein [Dyadobacter sp. CECT 9275]CAG5007502.1 hypothetical protein DYBT9275_04060 [Dyadobacter sp. CECT 9275]